MTINHGSKTEDGGGKELGYHDDICSEGKEIESTLQTMIKNRLMVTGNNNKQVLTTYTKLK